MRSVTENEMRAVSGGRYATCPVCGRRKNVAWNLQVLWNGWNITIQQAEAKMALRHAWGASCI